MAFDAQTALNAFDLIADRAEELSAEIGKIERVFFGSEAKEPDAPAGFEAVQDHLVAASGQRLPYASAIRDTASPLAAQQLPEGLPVDLEYLTLSLHTRHPYNGRESHLPGVDFSTEGLVARRKREAQELFSSHMGLALRGYQVRNRWYSTRLRRHVLIAELDGRIVEMHYDAERDEPRARFRLLENTYLAHHAWTLAAEEQALETLKGMLNPTQWANYQLGRTFMESSARSRVRYVLRQLRPTIAVSERTNRPLATLCLHPVGYYQDSFAGVLCPTDDVIAHLLMIRSDEHTYWKRATHHALHEVQSGV